jgi:curved DNA-binding protein
VLQVRVEPHPVFQRSGDTLEVTLPVSLSEALEGAKVDVPTPWGTIALRIPPGTSSGKKLRAAGMGVHHGNGAKGDLIAEVQIMLPTAEDAAVREPLLAAVKAAEATAPEAVRSRLQW